MDANHQDGVFVPERFLSQKGQKGPLRMHQDSSQVQDLLFNTVRGVRDRALRQGKKPVDHAKANRQAIADKSRQNARSRAGLVDEPKQPRRRKPPSQTDNGNGSDRRDFVHQNIVDAGTRRKSSATTAEGEDASKFLQKSNYGQVPTYLHERKMELAADYAREQAEKEASLIPAGMRIMGDEERIETLAVLQKNKEEVEDALSKLPFIVKIPSQVSLKNQLERRLHEIEEATKIFSRPKVLVKA